MGWHFFQEIVLKQGGRVINWTITSDYIMFKQSKLYSTWCARGRSNNGNNTPTVDDTIVVLKMTQNDFIYINWLYNPYKSVTGIASYFKTTTLTIYSRIRHPVVKKFLYEGPMSCFRYFCFVLRIVAPNTYGVVFLLCFSSSCYQFLWIVIFFAPLLYSNVYVRVFLQISSLLSWTLIIKWLNVFRI